MTSKKDKECKHVYNEILRTIVDSDGRVIQGKLLKCVFCEKEIKDNE